MLGTHTSRVYTLLAMLAILLILITSTVWGMYSVNKSIRALKIRTAEIFETTRVLENIKNNLEANIGYSLRLARISELQRANMPHLQLPKKYIHLQDLPFRSEKNSDARTVRLTR